MLLIKPLLSITVLRELHVPLKAVLQKRTSKRENVNSLIGIACTFMSLNFTLQLCYCK